VVVSVGRRDDQVIWSIQDSAAELASTDPRPGARGGRSRPASALGWALARGVVRAHGGRIWIERRSGPPGGGNVLRIALPLAGA
jgi:signal transduction histidine kinase